MSEPSEIDSRVRGAGLVLRLALIGLILAGIAGLFLYTGGWFSPKELSPAVVIDTFEKINGEHPGFRRNHAKGVCISGYFEGNGNGVALSKAAVFKTGRVPVIGRFGLAVGQPYLADAGTSVRSMALSFKTADGEEWRTGMNNIPVFIVNTVQDFYEQMLATAPDPATGKPDGGKIKDFFEKHPESAKALGLIRGQAFSSGFEDSTYNSLNAFRFVNEQGAVTPVRWAMVPVQPFVPVNLSQPEKSNTNYIFDALIAAVHSHPLQWHLVVTIAQPGDSTSISTVPWPPDRKQIEVGTLTIDQVESEDTSAARDMNFDPLILPNGITGSDDPLLSARSAAYSRSFTRREGEPKSPSAVSAAETRK